MILRLRVIGLSPTIVVVAPVSNVTASPLGYSTTILPSFEYVTSAERAPTIVQQVK